MIADLPLLVFTDIDGTLIDHDTYRWDAAAPALRKLRDIGAGVVLASSKTAAEIVELRDALDLTRWPAIVENGGGVLAAGAQTTDDTARYAELRAILAKTPPALRTHYRGFGDMDVSQIAAVTGLSHEAAALAAHRDYSEPGLWSGTDTQRDHFLDFLASHSISAREGGRFLTLSFGGTKADRMIEITSQYQAKHTVALGDAPNDIEMLEAADFGIVVANPHSATLPPLSGEDSGKIIRTTARGPDGWNIAMLDLIARLELKEGRTLHG
nr:HAD-IIB family hydrolase [Sulfitobacter noctilucae]